MKLISLLLLISFGKIMYYERIRKFYERSCNGSTILGIFCVIWVRFCWQNYFCVVWIATLVCLCVICLMIHCNYVLGWQWYDVIENFWILCYESWIWDEKFDWTTFFILFWSFCTKNIPNFWRKEFMIKIKGKQMLGQLRWNFKNMQMNSNPFQQILNTFWT